MGYVVTVPDPRKVSVEEAREYFNRVEAERETDALFSGEEYKPRTFGEWFYADMYHRPDKGYFWRRPPTGRSPITKARQ
jgi:hypothetical protein